MTPYSITAWMIRVLAVLSGLAGLFVILYHTAVAFNPYVARFELKAVGYPWVAFIWNLGDVVTYVAVYIFAPALAATLTGTNTNREETRFDFRLHGNGVAIGIIGLFLVLYVLQTLLNTGISLLTLYLEWGDISDHLRKQTAAHFANSIAQVFLGLVLVFCGRRMLRND